MDKVGLKFCTSLSQGLCVFMWRAEAGENVISVVIDPENIIIEQDETNNYDEVTTWVESRESVIGRLTTNPLFLPILLMILLALAVLGAGILYVPHFFVTAPWQLLILQAAVGLVMSGVLASTSALLAHLSPEGHEGAVYGVDASVVSIANAIGAMLGATVAATFGLRAPFLLAAGGFLLGAGLTWVLVPPAGKRKRPTASG